MKKEKFNFKLNKIVKDKTKQMGKEYLQVYFDLIDDESGNVIHKNGSFFVNGVRKEYWEEKFGQVINDRKTQEIADLEEKLAELKSQ